MRPGGACGRADLVRALVRGDPALADALADLLGFEVQEKPGQTLEPILMTLTGALPAITVVPNPKIEVGPLLNIPFWRLETYETVSKDTDPAVRLEPGLLRAVRLSLCANDADAGVEADAWQHPAIASTHSEAATLDPKRARELRVAFTAEPIDRQRRALALLRAWRSHLPEEIWFEEILNLAPVSREALPDAADLEDARRFFTYICGPFEANTESAAAAPRAWIERVTRRATAIWNDEVIGKRLLRVDWRLHWDQPDYRPPVPFDPALAPEPGPAVRYELRQRGGELILAPVSPRAAGAGSYLGTLRTGNRLVRIVGDDRNAFWTAGNPPRGRMTGARTSTALG